MLTPLRNVLIRAARSLGVEPAAHLASVQSAWPAIVGDELGRLSEPRSLRNGTIVVAAAHPVVAHELHFRQVEILARVRASAPGVRAERLEVLIRAGAGRERRPVR